MASAESKATTDPQTIKNWVEDRQGRPVLVEGTDIIRVDFGDEGARFQPIEWEQFFEIFEKNNLAFLYQETTSSGEISRFFKFVNR